MRAQSWDMSALGVAIAAGQSVGVWSIETWRQHATLTDTFLPTTTDDGKKFTPLLPCLGGIWEFGVKSVKFLEQMKMDL